MRVFTCVRHLEHYDFPYVARALFFKEISGLMAGSSQSKQWRIELLYQYKQAKTMQHNNSVKLYLYFSYFQLYVYFE